MQENNSLQLDMIETGLKYPPFHPQLLAKQSNSCVEQRTLDTSHYLTPSIALCIDYPNPSHQRPFIFSFFSAPTSLCVFQLAMAASTLAPTAVDPNSNYHYDVFINHRGPDVKKTFASHLYRRILSYGLRVFLDYQELQEGENLSSQIKGAIATASVHVAIFSPRYAESSWCLNELLLMLESGAPIIPVFHQVKPADLRWTQGEGMYARALHNLEKKRTYDSQPRYNSTTVENWRNALSALAEISGLDLEAFNGDEGELLDKVLECVLTKVKKVQLNVAKYPTGLDEKVKDFERTVLLQEQNGRVQIVGIVGLGGVGKTTLAKELFNRKNSNYNKSCFLSDVRENAKNSLYSLQQKLVQSLAAELYKIIGSIDDCLEMLPKHLSSSRVLLVLDDVDDVDQVDTLLPSTVKDALRSDSLILITSRDRDVLQRSGVQESTIYKLAGLDTQHSRELFCAHAFCQPHPLPGFELLVNKFLRACNGLPLSLKVFGSLLYGKNNESYWEDQLDRLEQILPNEILKRLRISYDALHRDEKQMFLDIACFFCGENKDTAIRIWDGSGWKGSLGFESLHNKCLVELGIENEINMHDHLRDLAKDSGLPLRIWRGIENYDDLIQQSSAVTEVRGVRMHDDPFASFSCYKMRKLQLLDIEDSLLEQILSSVHSPNLIWLRWYKCSYSSLPPWIPMKSLRVLKVSGNKLKTLWHDESQAPLQLRELQIFAPLSNIPKSIGQLKHLEHIVVTWPEQTFEKLPEEFCHLPSLKYLKLNYFTEMRSLPDSFGNLTNLKHIDLSKSNNLERLPNSFGNLTKLEHVDLSYCKNLRRLPNSFRNLRRLKYLALCHCFNLTIFSETLGNISTLEYMNLTGCDKIEVLPSQVAHQRSLKTLKLGLINLKELPSAIGELSNLEMLVIESPLLEELPPSLGDLRNLKYLNLLSCENLKHLPDSIGLLNQLTNLTVKGCNLDELPFKMVDGESGTWTEARGLRKWSNMDSSIDKCMLGLQHFVLYNIQILDEVSFAEDVCPNLQHLVIECCNDLVAVRTLPNALTKLDLAWCSKLRKLEGLRGLAKLEMLDINQCKEVEDLPSVETLISLEELRATKCVKLKTIRGLAQLTKLRILHVSECSALEELPGVEHLSSLEELQAFKCVKLKSIQGLGQLTRLRILQVSECSELDELPGVEHCISLEELRASNCVQLKSIGCLAQLTHLRILQVNECPELGDLPGMEDFMQLELSSSNYETEERTELEAASNELLPSNSEAEGHTELGAASYEFLSSNFEAEEHTELGSTASNNK